jgi:hypothetical protein
MLTVLVGFLILFAHAVPTSAQVITVVGTPHLTGLDPSPSDDQLAEVVDALAAFNPTQVCVERMSGERIEMLMADPARIAMTLRPETAGRPLATIIVPIGHSRNVPSELGLERLADLTDLKVENHLFELIDHHTSREPAKIATVWRCLLIRALLLGYLREVRVFFGQFLVDDIGGVLGCNQNVRRFNLLG